MTATLFQLRVRGAGDVIGAALVCPSARYASVRWRGAERLDRRFARPADWKAIETEFESLPATDLAAGTAIGRVLATDRGLVVQYMTTKAVEAPPAILATVLDALLRAHPLNQPQLRMRQDKP